jgi:hypothetical protein
MGGCPAISATMQRPRPQGDGCLLGLLPKLHQAIKAVYPHARFQADHFHTVQNIWGHLKKSLLSYRKQIKASGAEKKDEQLLALAKQLWKLRWSLLKKPGNLSVEEKQALAELEREDEGFVQSFRNIIRQLVHIFDHTHSEAQAKLRLHQLRQDIHVLADRHLDKIPNSLMLTGSKPCSICGRAWAASAWVQPSQGCVARGLEENHDGVRSPAPTALHSDLPGNKVPLLTLRIF